MKSLILSLAFLALVYGQNEYKREFDGIDANKDGFIATAELDAIFKALDVNKTGSVSIERFLTVFLNSSGRSLPEALFRFFMMDANYDNRLTRREFSASFMKADANKDGKISFDEYKVASNVVKADLATALQEEPLLKAKFQQADTNKNGTLNPTELLSYVMRADKNGDGEVSQAELVEFWNTGLPANATDRLKKFAGSIFGFIDVDDDGFFGEDQIERRIAFNGFDHNGNNEISYDEFTNTMLFIYAMLIKAPAGNVIG